MSRIVVHLLGTAQRDGTSIARIVAALAAGLDRDAYRVHAWFLGHDGPLCRMLADAGAEVRCLRWSGGAGDLSGALRMARALHATSPSIFHQHTGGRAARRLARWVGGAKVVTHVHGYVAESQGAATTLAAIGDADIVIAASVAIAQHVRAREVRIVYFGVAVGPAHPSASMPFVIGVACRLTAIKDVSTLVRAMALLRDEFPQVHLEIAGDGPEFDALERLVDTLGLRGTVRFLGWCDPIDSHLTRWSLFALSSRAEGLGIAAVEAMAAGLPVVASAVGGLREVVDDGVTGALVRPEDPQAFAAALRRLIASPRLRDSMGSAGRDRAQLQFSISKMVESTVSIYDGLLR